MKPIVALFALLASCGRPAESDGASTLAASDTAAAAVACTVEPVDPQVFHLDDCPRPGKVVDVQGTHPFDARCSYLGVRFRLSTSGATLDCGGKTLMPSTQHPESKDLPAIEIFTPEGDGPPPEGLVVRNCNVRGYGTGVSIATRSSHKRKMRMLREHHRLLADDLGRYLTLMGMEDMDRDASPRGVRVENVHVRDTSDVGIYVYNSVVGAVLDRVSVIGTGSGPGIYLDSGSRHNRIQRSCIARSEREGLAIDASAFNVVSGNVFRANTQAGIHVYKNAGEHAFNPDTLEHKEEDDNFHHPRQQHAEGNVIEGNVFENELRGVWIAARASDDYTEGFFKKHFDPKLVYCVRGGRPVPAVLPLCNIERYYRDFAEANTVRNNQFQGYKLAAVVIEDDHALVSGNFFKSNADNDVAIWLGSRVRDWQNRPIYGAALMNNEFHKNVDKGIDTTYCSTGTLASGNRQNGKPYQPKAPSCDLTPQPKRLHPAQITAVFR